MDQRKRPSPQGIINFLTSKCRFDTSYRDRFGEVQTNKNVCGKFLMFRKKEQSAPNSNRTQIEEVLNWFETRKDYVKKPFVKN